MENNGGNILKQFAVKTLMRMSVHKLIFKTKPRMFVAMCITQEDWLERKHPDMIRAPHLPVSVLKVDGRLFTSLTQK